MYVFLFLVTTEMVRLSTENDYLKQEKEKLEDTSTKMSQKAASLVSYTHTHTCNSIHTVMLLLDLLSDLLSASPSILETGWATPV